MAEIRPIMGIYFIVSIALLFLYVNNPFSAIKEVAELGLFFLIAGVLFLLILTQSPALKTLTVKDPREMFAELSIGMILGLITITAVNFFLAVSPGVINFTGSIAPLVIQQMDATQILYIVLLFPFIETVILVGGTIVLGSFFKGFIPAPKIVAGIITAAGFAAFHFNALAGQTGALVFEYSLSGFGAFILSPQGALPAFIMGILWIALFLVWDSWTVIWSAHTVTNAIAMGGILDWSNDIIFFVIIALVGIFAITYYKIPKLFWQKLNDYNLGRLS